MYGDCSCQATHILVNYNHEIINGGEVYCELHAFDEGREVCSICENYDYKVEFDDEELRPTYEELDVDGCCSIHP
jgi:hypothetical protein